MLTLPLLARESPQSAGSVRLLDFFSSWSPASSMMGSSLVYEQTHSRGKPAGDRHANMSKKKKEKKKSEHTLNQTQGEEPEGSLRTCSIIAQKQIFLVFRETKHFHLYLMILK